MELLVPTSFPITLGAVVAFISMLSAIIGVYWRLSNQLTTLSARFDKMELRNVKADHETEAVKMEQAAQKTTVAVMAEQIAGLARTLERVDRNTEELVKRGHNT